MNKNIIIGLGTGRCGTVTLAHLLNKQPNFSVTHEFNPTFWEFDYGSLIFLLNKLEKRTQNNIGDIAYYHLNYCEHILDKINNVKFPIMIRNKEDVVKSYMKWTNGRNHWSKERSRNEKEDKYWDKTYPKYNLPKIEALNKYYDDYYTKCNDLINKYPNKFKLFEMLETFNTESGQNNLLDFIGINENDRILDIGIRKNAS